MKWMKGVFVAGVSLCLLMLGGTSVFAKKKAGGAIFKIDNKTNLKKMLNKEKDTKANRLKAANAYFRLVPMKQMIEETTQMIAQRLPAGKRMKFVTAMRTKFRIHLLKQAAVKSFVSRFSLGEIKALTAFMKKPEGRSVMKKMKYYTADIMPVLQRELRRSMQAAGLQ